MTDEIFSQQRKTLAELDEVSILFAVTKDGRKYIVVRRGEYSAAIFPTKNPELDEVQLFFNVTKDIGREYITVQYGGHRVNVIPRDGE